ncbi:activator of basal transcription 1 [Thalassophryne amazonica]|uniref:activator of basal transcription 1 n=1 Tax=Thalassophryne amazonica TaxID=390379 RepID=UPI001470B555|nr:activator of basal transcription 1 [Thalassophryne amazonica]XP_034027706.1 activator of basal transcription 1 [Thalassophryne amazonica]
MDRREEEEPAEDSGDDCEEVQENDAAAVKKTTTKRGGVTSCAEKRCVPGILYLGHIPPRLRPKHVRNLLSPYGEIGRIFLQPENRMSVKRKKKLSLRRCNYTEGWVEFRDKRVAKQVALSLNNTPMATRKRQSFSSDLWSIKYLHRFQWTQLNERLAYEQAVLQQRLRTEVSQAKRETNFYLNSVGKSAHMDRMSKKRQREGQEVEEKTWDFTQRCTEEEIQMKKKLKEQKGAVSRKRLDKIHLIQQKSQSNVSLLAKIFNSKQSE